MNDIEKIVKARHSVRSYLDRDIDNDVIKEINKIITECNKEGNLNIQLILNDHETFDNFIFHYGIIKNAKNYLALIGKIDKYLEEKAGYYGEKIVLKLQELGLNTCWLGGTYNKGLVKAKIEDDEKLVCIIALGYGKNQGKPHKSKSFSDVSITKDGPIWYKKGIEYALLAPTAINQQKFKFKLLDNNTVSLKSGVGIMTKVDLGIVRYHFELGANKHNFKWEDWW